VTEQVPLPLGASPWAEVVASLEGLIAEARRSPEVQRERHWYCAHHAIDIDEVLSTPEGRLGFHAGMLYVRCQQECQP
jgi:hypothetical protein